MYIHVFFFVFIKKLGAAAWHLKDTRYRVSIRGLITVRAEDCFLSVA